MSQVEMSKAEALSSPAGRYALALFELIQEKKAEKAVAKDLAAVKDALHECKEFRAAIDGDISYPDSQLEKALAKIGKKGGFNKLTHNFLIFMARKKRLGLLPDILDELESLTAKRDGIVTVYAATAAPLSSAQEKKISDLLSKHLDCKILLKNELDKSVMGGLVIRYGSRMIDRSVRSRLSQFRAAMKEVG